LPIDYNASPRIQGCSMEVDLGAIELNDMPTGVVMNTNDDGAGSLRYEIECAE